MHLNNFVYLKSETFYCIQVKKKSNKKYNTVNIAGNTYNSLIMYEETLRYNLSCTVLIYFHLEFIQP